MLRRLNPVEQAFTYSNEVHPLCVVIVLRIRNAPDVSRLRAAVDALQRRHLLLQAAILTDDKGYFFETLDPTPPLDLRIQDRRSEREWESVVERELNTTYDKEQPLLRFVYVTGDDQDGELVFVLHHSIMDGVSARLLLHELLHLWNDLPLDHPLSEAEQLAPFALPKSQGGLGPDSRIRFMWRQAAEEVAFAIHGMTSDPAPTSENAIVHLAVPADLSRRIGVRIGREGLNLNNVVNAAMLLAVQKHLHPTTHRRMMRAISFADLRERLTPTPNEAVLGCMVSMLRFPVSVENDDTVVTLARKLKNAMFAAGRSGDSFHFAKMSPTVTRMALRLQHGRLANTAVSFLGRLDLEPRYGGLQLEDVHAFITNNRLGPELSGFGKVLFGRIELDLTYLKTAINMETASELLSEIRVSLAELAA